MAKKRKAKKEAKKMANGKQKQTTFEEVIKDKKQPETKKPEPKTIIGFGRKGKSTTIHAISSLQNSALCDKRTKDITIDSSLSPKDCNCNKCMKYSIYKQLLVVKPTEQEDKEEIKGPEKVKEKPLEQTKPKEITVSDDTATIIADTVIDIVTKRFQKVEKRLLKNLKEYCEELILSKPQFFLSRKANNLYQIIHDATRYVIIENIKEETAEKLLPLFLEIHSRWNGQDKAPNEWLTEVRKICEQAKEKPKAPRKLKRRPKPSIKKRKDRKEKPRKIKRRQK